MGRPKIERIKVCETCKREFDAGSKKNKKNCSNECRKIYNQDHKEDRIKKTFEAIQKKFGKNSFFETDGFYDKVKKIKKEKYGDEKYNNYNKIKSSLKDKYNVENPSKIENHKEKSESTKLSKYNDKNFNNRNKAKKTNIEKLGVDHHLKTKESLDKLKETNKSKYGVDYNLETEKCKNKLIEYNQNKFGSDFYYNSEKYLKGQRSNRIDKIKKTLKENDLQFDIIQNNKENYQLTCKSCDNKFEWSFETVPVCRRCFPLTSISKLQDEFKKFLTSINLKFVESTKKIIPPMELDFYIEEFRLAFELNGNYFHSELRGNKYPNYHLYKSIMCEENKIRLIHIFEDEWLFKKEIVKDQILDYLGLIKNNINAIDCEIKTITNKEKKEFLETNHIKGNDVCSISLGLFQKNKLLSVMTFKTSIITSKNNRKSIELSRFCSKLNHNVIDGFEKLLDYFIKNYIEFEELFLFADCRFNGTNPENINYKKYGFEFLHRTKPNYFYFEKNDYFNRHNRFKFNKQKFIKTYNENSNLTEWEMAKKNKFDRIWDCGSLKFKLKLR